MPHIVYKKLRLRNAYSYRECNFDLENQGLVFVRGLNVDDGGFLGAGKSSLFEAFSVLQMGKGGKNTNLSDMVNHDVGKDMEVSLLLSIDEKDYKLVLYQKHSKFGNGMSAIDLNSGKNIVPTNNAKHAPKWIREELLKTSDTTFFHLTYLAQRMTNVLLTGTDAQRKHQITEMFDLNIYDKLSSHVDVQIKLAETDLRRLDNLEEELRQIRDTIKNNLSIKKLRKRHRIKKKKLKENSVVLEATIRELRDVEENLREAKQRVHHIRLVKEIWSDTPLLHKDMDKLTDCTNKYIIRQRKRLTTIQEKHASYKEAVKQLDRRSIIEKQLKKLEGIDVDVEEINQKLTLVKTKISNLQNVELPAAEIRQELLQKMQALDLPDMELEEAKEKLESLKEDRMLVLTSIKAFSSQLEGDVCPTCKRPFDRSVEEINKAQRSLDVKRQELKKLQQNVHHYNKYVTDLQEYDDCQIRLQEVTTKRRTKAIQVDINKLTQKERDLTLLLDGAQRKKILENQLKVMTSGSAEELRKKQRQAKVREERTETKLEGAKRINAELLKIKELPKCSKRKLEKKVKRLEISIQGITNELSGLSEQVVVAQSALQQVVEATAREVKLSKDLKKVRGLVDKNECYKALKIAFGQKGLKHDRLHAIMKEAVERTVPLYANILWPNRTVSLDLEPTENAIRFQLSRLNSKGTSSRALSGGESHKAGLAFLFGLRDLKEIYTDYSSNVLVLDEPFSHLDPQGKLALLQILQMLKNKFSSIFVVSHLTEMVHNNAWDQVWWTIRENNESHLYQKEPPSRYLQLSRRYEDELNT